MYHRSIGKRFNGQAIAPQSIAAGGTANGATISDPSRVGRTLRFGLITGALVGVTVLTVKPQGRVTSVAAWEDIPNEKDGTPITFDAADTIAGGSAATGKALVGNLPLDRLPYRDYRLIVSTVTGAAALVAAWYEIDDLFEEPTDRKDHFFFKATPYEETDPVSLTNG